MTARYAIFGSPVGHSLSPRMHAAWYAHVGIDATYGAVETRDLTQALADLPDLAGGTVTMPLKEQAYAVAAEVDPHARRTGVANTLLRVGSLWHAFNTDVVGLNDLLDAAGIVSVERATVIGAGATARSALAAVAARAGTITVMARDRHRAAAALATADGARFLPWDEASPALDADLVISTTPAGATDQLHAGAGVLVEVIYRPWPTALAARWDGPVIDGFELLVRQAVRQVQIFFPGSDPSEAYRILGAAAREA